ncbi:MULTISPECIES: pyruvate kinase [Faecalibacterium]|jgi:pyruvate kinase|uniref:pyruvate kinase n=1 Tax=Faecalibacterium TaxID=216851 RepID=UPI000E48109B|nr:MULTISPECIES: pyruvate kinase [Faecalibacterium]RHQ30046.1 pyruvate kinase [Faecalibacterium sp. AF28-13AC]
MRKTKIICTLGPSTDKGDVLRELIANGMNVARFNFSHGSYEEHGGRLANLKALREELGKPVAALLDTKGPEIRLKEFKNGVEMLEAGQTFTLTTREVEGTKEICSVTYKDLPHDVHEGGTIMLDDGLIMLRIEKVTDTDITCTVLNSGKIKTKKGVNVPGVHLSMPYLSQKDREDIIFGIQNGFDFIAASFVRTAQDVYDIRNLLNEYDSNIRIIAKIENREGVNNIDSILSAADAVMVARGDLGVEIDFTELPGIQKNVIDRSFSFGKPIVTATQMLDSMMVNPRPTRAEISDVANAIYDGTSAIMLSGETAAGAYPVEALKTMSAIAERTENEPHYRDERFKDAAHGQISVSDATAHAACLTARDVNAAAIVTVSESGNTARLLSKYRPTQPIIACVMNEQVQRQLSLSWGITSLLMGPAKSTDELIEMSTALAQKNGYLHNGELAVVTAGVPVGVSGTTNMIKIHMVGNCLSTGVGVGRENADLTSASGKACVCRTLDEVRAKFKPGMVLVVPSTTNEMLEYVRDAAALVVEEAGLNSHAAIAGKALLKPTIVGALGACSHIRDGLDIAVDCAHGSVQRLQA